MKIAIACERFDASAGGLAHYACQLVRKLCERGHEVHVVTFQADVGRDADAANVFVLPWSNSRNARSRAARVALEGLHADVTHDLNASGAADILHPQAGSGRANRRRDVASRTRLERWQQRLRPSYWRWLADIAAFERRAFSRHRGLVIAVSHIVAGDLRRLHGVAVDQIRLIPNAVDTEAFHPDLRRAQREKMRRDLGVAANETLFLFAAHNLRLKGLRPLLHALGQLRNGHARARLEIIGGSPEPAHAQLVSALAIGDVTHFAGLVSDPRPYYAAADAFVLPTFHDACSLTVLEACASGLPAITTQCNGAAELITPGQDGFVISDATAVDELVSAMTICLDAGRRERVGSAARTLAVRCSLDRHADAIEALYRECVARGEAAR